MSKKPSKELLTTIEKIEKDFGKGSIMKLGDKPVGVYDTISTGSLSLDLALGVGGLVKGRIVEVYGPESCLDESTFIQYSLRTLDGRRQSSNGGSIKNLFERFHNLTTDGRKKRANTKNSEYFATCVNEEGRIFQNKILDVVHTGKKECYEICTKNGFSITATKDHKFFTGTQFKKLGDLFVGDQIMVHNGTRFKKSKIDREDSVYRNCRYVKHHPVAGVKRKGPYAYHRLSNSRAVMEAHMNNLSLNEYLDRLNSNNLENLVFLKREDHVHHKDENILNDCLSNLVLISASEHGRLHAIERHNNLRYTIVPAEIHSITLVGDRDTYDIKMDPPFNNYIANNFVVHNCGKTTLATHVIAEAQKKGGNVAVIDAEYTFDINYATALGVKVDDLYINQPSCTEEGLEITCRLAESGQFDLIVIDSVAALVPKKELEGEIGDSSIGVQSRLMSQTLRKLAGAASKSNTLVIFINQIREKIGVMFGNPETTTGGRALAFYSSVRIDVRKTAQVKDGDEVTANQVKAKIVKNKLAPPFRFAEFNIIFGEGIDKYGEVLDTACAVDVVQKSGSWYSYKTEKIGQGREAVRLLLKDNPELFEEIRSLTLSKIKTA